MKKYLLEEKALSVILAIQVLLVCAGVLARWDIFPWPLSFTEELTRYLLVWLACLGFSACWPREEMIRFRWPVEKSAIVSTILRWITLSACALFFTALLYSSIQMIALQWRYGQNTSVMGWPIVWVSLALPVVCLLFGWRLFVAWKKG